MEGKKHEDNGKGGQVKKSLKGKMEIVGLMLGEKENRRKKESKIEKKRDTKIERRKTEKMWKKRDREEVDK